MNAELYQNSNLLQVDSLPFRHIYANGNAGFTVGMKGVDDIRRDNLRAIIRFELKTQAAFAKLMEYEPSLVSRLLTDNPTSRQNIGKAMARAIESKLLKPKFWLDTPQSQYSLAEDGGDYNVHAAPDLQRRIPLISWVQAGNWKGVVDNLAAGDAEQWYFTTAKVGPNAFALRVVGDSMTNPSGAPSFPEGMIIIVDPAREAAPGKFVVIRQNDDEECTFKQLVRDGGRFYLKPLNPRYPIMELAPDAHVCGVLVQAIWDF